MTLTVPSHRVLRQRWKETRFTHANLVLTKDAPLEVGRTDRDGGDPTQARRNKGHVSVLPRTCIVTDSNTQHVATQTALTRHASSWIRSYCNQLEMKGVLPIDVIPLAQI